MSIERIPEYPFPEKIEDIDGVRDFLIKFRNAVQDEASDRLVDFEGLTIDDLTVVDYSVQNSFKPTVDNAVDIGATTLRFKDLYLSGSLKDDTVSLTVANAKTAYDNRVDTWGDGLQISSFTASIDYNTTNLKITSTKLNTIQDIATTSSVTFANLTLTQNSDTITIAHDGSNAYIKWSDGDLTLMTNEGTNTDTRVSILGKGTGVGLLEVYDTDEDSYIILGWKGDDQPSITCDATPTEFNLLHDRPVDIKCWSSIISGNPYFYTYGFKAGDAVKYLRQGVEADGDALIQAEGNLNILADGGAITFGNENLSTTGTLAAGNTTITGIATLYKAGQEVDININAEADQNAQVVLQTAGSDEWAIYRPANSVDLRVHESTVADQFTFGAGGNFGIGVIAFGSSAGRLLGIGGSTAPTTSPTDMAQLWVEDRGGNAGYSQVHYLAESGKARPLTREFDVSDYGLVPDDNSGSVPANNVTAWTALIGDTAAGDKIYFPKGTWYVNDSLAISQSVLVYGDGAGSKIQETVNSKNILDVSVSNVIIEKLNIIGTGQASTGGTAIDISGANASNYLNNVKVIDCKMSACNYGIVTRWLEQFEFKGSNILDVEAAGILIFYSQDGEVHHNYIEDVDAVQGYGIIATRAAGTLATYPRSARIKIHDNIIKDVLTWEGIDTHSGDQIDIYNNTIILCKRGIMVGSDNDTPDHKPIDCTVHGNTIDSSAIADNTRVAAIHFGGVAAVTITDTTIAFVNSNPDTITDSNDGFVAAGFVAGMVIDVSGSSSNNGRYTIATVAVGTITLIGTDTLSAEGAGASMTLTSDYLATGSIIGNTIRGHGKADSAIQAAIIVQYTEGLEISGNTLIEPSPYGIILSSNNVGFVITGNTIIDPFTDAVGVGECDGIVSDVTNNAGYIGDNSFIRGKKSATYVLDSSGTGTAIRIDDSAGTDIVIGTNYSEADTYLLDPGNHVKSYFPANVGIGTATFGTSMVGGLAMKNATAPSGNVTNCFQMYSADIAGGNAAPFFRTENGTVIKLGQELPFMGATGENLIKISDNLLDAWSIQEGSNKYFTVVTVDDEEDMKFYKSVDIIHLATHPDDHALEIDTDAANLGDVKAIDIDYITGSIDIGQDEAIILVNIDETIADGGDVFGLEVLSTDGSANIYGMKVGAVVNPVHQDSGTFINPDIGTNNTVSTNVPYMIDGILGNTTAIFQSNSEYIIIGVTASAFQEIEFIISTGASGAGIKPTFHYSTAVGGVFSPFTPVDGTSGFKHTGIVAWDADDLATPAHAANPDTSKFEIKVIRTRGNLTTSPVLGYAKTAATTEYTWDKDGALTVASLKAPGVTIGNSDTARLSFLDDNAVTRAFMEIRANDILYIDGDSDIYIQPNNTQAAVFKADGSLALGEIWMLDDQIWDNSDNANGAITINNVGKDGGTTQFKNFSVNDGKNNQIAVFMGSTRSMGIGRTPANSFLLDVDGIIRFGASAGNNEFYTFDNTINGQWGNNADDGNFWLNYRGYQNGTTRFRDLNIGDGKQSLIAFFDGSSGDVTLPAINSTDAGDYDLRYDAVNGIVYDTSDIRQKENHLPLEYGLAEILQLQPKRYTYYVGKCGVEEDGRTKKYSKKDIEITSKSIESFGLIAQDVYDVIPEAVYKPKDETKAFWGLRTKRLIPILINAIRELNTKIEALEAA